MDGRDCRERGENKEHTRGRPHGGYQRGGDDGCVCCGPGFFPVRVHVRVELRQVLREDFTLGRESQNLVLSDDRVQDPNRAIPEYQILQLMKIPLKIHEAGALEPPAPRGPVRYLQRDFGEKVGQWWAPW